MRPAFEVARVINDLWPTLLSSNRFNTWQLRTMDAIRRCRTASLGGHVDMCTDCGHTRISYNSCRNRHCPKCQQIQRERWIQAREAELLPVTYFHVVFTLPDTLNILCLANPALLYKILFDTAWGVMKSFAADHKHLGAATGMITVLHTWGQNLSLHPHLHCIVPAGGITKNQRWRHARGDGKFLFPVDAMSEVFRARFVSALRAKVKGLDRTFYNQLFKNQWVVYTKQAFGGPKQVIEYLGRYTHKIAISNHRLINVNQNEVTFRYKDYRDESKSKVMTLSNLEFIRRFALHILPRGFMRIRHYGILSSSRKEETLPLIHAQLNSTYVIKNIKDKHWRLIAQDLGFNPDCCPACKHHSMITVLTFDRRGPPDADTINALKEKYRAKAVQKIEQA